MQRPSQLQAPFFRMPQGTHYESPQAMQRRGSQAQANYFRTQPRSQQLATGEREEERGREREEERGRESLTYAPALAKLKLEADKIRKWKTATQFELKQKESQLEEVRERLRVQSEAVTGLRVREESLKTRLQDEVASHTELQHKILVTRGLCSTLKEKVEQIGAALGQGRADHNDNMDLDNLRMEQYRALAVRFRELEQETGKVQRSLEEALKVEQEKRCDLNEKLTNERAQNKQLCSENTLLQNQLTALISEEQSVRGQLEEAERRVERGREEAERRVGEEERGREEAEEQSRQLQQQLRTAQEQCATLQATITSLTTQVSSLKSEHSAAEARLQQEVAESREQCREMEAQTQQQLHSLESLQSQLSCSTRARENMEIALTALREELCAVEYSRRDDMARVQREAREKEEAHSLETGALKTRLASVNTSLAALQTQLSESEVSCAATDKELTTLTHSLAEREAVSAGLQSEVKGLQDRVVELERGEEEERGEREKEKREAQATILSLTSQLETLRSEKEGLHKTQGERVCQLESEKGEMVRELSEARQQLEHAVRERESEREREQQSMEVALEEVRSQCAREVEQCRQEAERAQETQQREKEGFDTQVTELCGMLEKYRSENNKIVQQKDLQIHSLQASLADANKAKESLEEMVRTAQEEAESLGEELRRQGEELHRQGEELRRQGEEVREREARAREKEEEMAELLKAVDTLRRKQSGHSTPQSTPTSTPHPSHSSPLAQQPQSPHTPQVPVVSSMVPSTAPLHTSLHSLRHQRSSETVRGRLACSLSTPRISATPPVTYATPTRSIYLRPAVKKPRCEQRSEVTEEEEGVAGYEATDAEDILFRKPRPLRDTKTSTRAEYCVGRAPNSVGGVSSVGEVSSTAVSRDRERKTKSVSANTRVRGGRGRKSGGGARERKGVGGERKQAGTAWFDLDAVFGFGPKD